ncbi:hypothetical protein FRC12_010438 [Ceratobasidium sp. 428]|nr:hypothetical protein FRC12_010438 [Ceratobasidium sp. 428]
MDKAATHLLIGPDDAENVDSQKLQWVIRLNKKRREEQAEEPPIHVVWDSWLLHCAVAGTRVPEAEFAYSEDSERPDPPEDIERVLRRTSNKKPAKVYVTASSVGAGTSAGGKEVLEKARIRKAVPAESMWNSILSASQGAREPDSFVPPTQFQRPPPSTPPRSTSPLPVSSAPPPAINVDDSATEDEDESVQEKPGAAASSSRVQQKAAEFAAPDPPTPVIQSTARLGTAKATSMVSRINSLRDSAFQLGTGNAIGGQNVPSSVSRTLPRVASISNPSQGPGNPTAITNDSGGVFAAPAAPAARVFAGKRIAAVGEARGATLYAALRTHGAIIIGELETPDPKGKGKAKDTGSTIILPSGEVDYYIVRLASESAREARTLDCYDKFRTDCWVEHCIFEDRLCPAEDNITYAPLKIRLPVPGVEDIKLNWTGLNNDQESAAKRLVKVLGITVTETFAKRTNTHLLCGSKSGIKYQKALQWSIPLVDMNWLYNIAKEGHIPEPSKVGTNLPEDTTAGPSVIEPTDLQATSKAANSGHSPLLGTPNGLLGTRSSPAEPAPAQQGSATSDPVVTEPSLDKSKTAPNAHSSSSREELAPNGADASTAPNSQSKASDRDREREAHRSRLADSLGELLKKHQLDESAPPEQPRKRIRPLQRQKLGNGAESGSSSRSLSGKVSSMSLQTRISDPEYVSPLEAIEAAQEETLQVHYMDPNQHAAKEGLLKLLDGSSQFPEAEVINLDTQTEPEASQEPEPAPAPAPVPAKRKRGGATSARSSGKRKSQRKT